MLREAPFSNMLGVFGKKFYCFHFFCHFLLLYNSNFLLSVKFSETIWISSFLSDICDVTLACCDGGCSNVLRIEYPDS